MKSEVNMIIPLNEYTPHYLGQIRENTIVVVLQAEVTLDSFPSGPVRNRLCVDYEGVLVLSL